MQIKAECASLTACSLPVSYSANCYILHSDGCQKILSRLRWCAIRIRDSAASTRRVDVKTLNEFNEGDVVLINKQGEIVFLYEIKSMHNAIFATERCNHRCIMCPQPPVAEEEDKTPFNLKLISLIDKNTVEVGITGGEPTLIGDKLFELIRQIQKCMLRT